MKTHIFESDEILAADDLYEIQEQVSSFGNSIQYRLTPGELGWIDFIRGKYSIADYLDDHMQNDPLPPYDAIVTIDSDVSQAMDDDCHGMGKAVMLSDDTALQKILFWVYTETENDDES